MNSTTNSGFLPSERIDLSTAVVVASSGLTGPPLKAIDMLIYEVEKRTLIEWPRADGWPDDGAPVVAVGLATDLSSFAGAYAADLEAEGAFDAAEGYRIRVKRGEHGLAILVIGNDARGLLYGVGYLLRTMRLTRSAIRLPADLDVTTSPHYRLRGHQLGYRDKTNSYCGWDLPQWEQYIRDLVIFGANAIELIPPRSDDKRDSVHFPRPPLEMMAGMSQIAADYGIDVWIWFPAMDADYTDPATVDFALREWREVFERLPRIDAIFVPGGDPGRTQPSVLLAMLEKQAAQLSRLHPGAEWWLSPQGFTDEWMDEFVGILANNSPAWLDGLVHGPWVHMTMGEFRALIPDTYPLRNYPDITHSLNCQFPVPDWDVAYAVTEGREPINPRPLDQVDIFHYSMPHTIGFLAYCEGNNDDVNKCIWSCLGWDPSRDVTGILCDYSRYFIGDGYAESFAQGLLALERNWRGPLAANAGVVTTLLQFQAMEETATPHDLKNWRFQQALYRAYYDAYVRSRLLYEMALEEQALTQLRQAPAKGSRLAMDEAERILDQAVTHPIASDLRTRLFQLAEALFQSIHMQLSVPLYRGQHETRGANLDGADFPLNNRPWLTARFADLRDADDEAERLAGLREIVNWTNPGPGGFYYNLSDASLCPHLVPGPGYAADPAFLRSPLRNYPYIKERQALRCSWRSYTIALKDAPLCMHYPTLDPTARYRLRVVYGSINAQIPIRLEANEGIEVHPPLAKESPPRPVEFDIPSQATQDGELTLRWYRAQGVGGAGRGCDVSEVWLIRMGEDT